MRDRAILVAFFPGLENAREIPQELRQRGLRRTALIHRTQNGLIVYDDVSPAQRILLGMLVGIFLAVTAVFVGHFSFLYSILAALIFLYVGIGIGALLAPIVVRNLLLTVHRSILERHARRLVTDETAIIIRATPVTIGKAIKILRQISKDQPSIFVFRRKKSKSKPVWERSSWDLLTASRVEEHARKLAQGHVVSKSTVRKAALLRGLDECEKIIDEVYLTLSESSHLEQSITTSAEWILDNTFIIRGHIDEVRKNLPVKFYQELPGLADGPQKGEPKAYDLAMELVVHNDSQLDQHNILDFLEAYQSVSVLTSGELWALPHLLRIALIDDLSRLVERVEVRLGERELADYWANRLMITARRNPDLMFTILSDMAEDISAPSVNFALQLLDHLYDEESVLAVVEGWLGRKLGGSLENLLLEEKALQAADEVSIGNGITSLRWLRQIDWRDIFEKQSRVEGILREDPSWVYPQMEFDTKDRYRHAVEEIARSGSLEEELVARAAVSMASGEMAKVVMDRTRIRLGYYLIGDGRKELLKFLGTPENPRRRRLEWIYKNHTLIYLGQISLITVAVESLLLTTSLFADVGWGITTAIVLAGLLPASQFAVQLGNYLVTRLLPPRKLPKMSFEKSGIPDGFRTLVVVPILLTDRKNLREDLENLEIRYQANPENNLVYSLFSDHKDAPEKVHPDDKKLLNWAIDGIKELDEKYGPHRFYLFHRDREWAPTENCWMGWERKRGKLEDLNRLLNGEPSRNGIDFIRFGDPDRLPPIRYVITLDRDTQLARGTARRLVETMAHPLNSPRIDEERGIVTSGYTIIQPRVSTSLPSATATTFSRLFTDGVGSDPYTTAVSDVYMDLSGEGSYHGKGIYDPRAFHKVLTGRFPDARLLSHDLVEGAYTRVGLASDIELFDDFPGDYISYSTREHRWICGDWQIARWAFSRVLSGKRKTVHNPLTLLNRWKIFDNLRRSLVSLSSILLLGIAWMSSPILGAAAGLLVIFVQFSGCLAVLTSWVTSKKEVRRTALSNFSHDLQRGWAESALMLHRTGIAIDAIIRVFYRLMISRKNLLQWTTAQAAADPSRERNRSMRIQIASGTVLALVLGTLSFIVGPWNFISSAPFIFAWLGAPLILWRYKKDRVVPGSSLNPGEEMRLREIGRRTWRTFDDFVGPETNWLPSDNYQLSHVGELAPRTSPTNIGLYMLSVLGARDFGYITGEESLGRITHTVSTLEKLIKYEGHLLNWYNLLSLDPLVPRYVSTVDSGNLLACFWTLEHGIEALSDEPILGPVAFKGLADTVRVLLSSMETAKIGGEMRRDAKALENLLTVEPEDLKASLDRLRRARKPIDRLALSLKQMKGEAPAEIIADPGVIDPVNEVVYWAVRVQDQLAAWLEIADTYLGWVTELFDLSIDDLKLLFGEDGGKRLKTLSVAPSMRQLAAEKMPFFEGLEKGPEGSKGEMIKHLKDLLAPVVWQAWEALERADNLVQRIRDLGQQMNFRFLYDTRKRLFHIGFNINDQKLDSSNYDMLASESRLASFVAIAKGDVPSKHWYALARPYSTLGRRKVLLSWSGTMFEYLMPLLMQKTYENSLLDQACREAVLVQMRYGQQRGVPWGISESAYADLDSSRIYQYKAFGVPGLGLKRGLEGDLVVAPYATLLALQIEPRIALANLERLEKYGLFGDYGFYESIDFSRRRIRKGEQGVIVRTFMAHHQAMGFLALDNLLNKRIMQERFHSDVRVKASEPLLYERIPLKPPVYSIPRTERDPSGAIPAEIYPAESKFNTPHTLRPKTQLLSNGDYSILVTAAGGGWSRWNGLDITRWRADTTRDNWGTFCYIRNTKSDKRWGTSWHPVGGRPDNYVVSMTLDRIEIRRSDRGIETETEIIVCPEDDAEIRRVTLINRSGKTIPLEVTSFAELSLAPHGADVMHPAFHKLFVRTEAIEEEGYLLAQRRTRDPEDQPVWAGHSMIFESAIEGPFLYETDRRSFIGRGRGLADPEAIGGELSGNTGMVLDPIFSIRRNLTLKAGQRVSFTLFLCAAETRDKVLDMLRKYSGRAVVARELELAWRSAQLELRHLRIQPEEARRFQHIASYLIFPSAKLRTTEDRIVQNRLGQSRLWAYGISGDLPIIAITIGDARDIGLVAEALHAHTYWRRHGLKADLVIINEESTSYEQPLYSQLLRLISGLTPYTGMDQPGGVFLRNMDQIPQEDLNLILAVAQIALVAARGPLVQQLGAPTVLHGLPLKEIPERVPKETPPAALHHMDLDFDNGYGGFSEDGKEYVITLRHGITPMPWVNVMSNPSFGTMVSETGSGFTWYGNSQRNRLTGWSNDPVSDPPGDAIYIRDEESGQFWTPTLLPVREDGPYRIRHGSGYTVFEHNSHGIEQELTVLVPMDSEGGDPVRIQSLRLRNDSNRRRLLSVTFFLEWVLGDHRENTQMHIVTNWDKIARTMTARNRYHPEYGDRVAFAAVRPYPDSCTGDRTEFIGRNRGLVSPEAMRRVSLSGHTGAGLDPCSAIQTMIEIEPGRSTEVVCLLGQAADYDEARTLVTRYGHGVAVGETLETTRQWWDNAVGRLEVATPVNEINILLNRWLTCQTLSCRLWGRSAFYQSGGAFGFRDQLQDVLSLLYTDPGLARKHILLAASRQFREGDVQHWWHPPTGAGIRSRCSDDLLWLPYAVAEYVRFTGDTEVLSERLSFIEGDLLGKDEMEIFQVPVQSLEQDTLYEHCRRAVEKGSTTGERGLPLIGSGDWNDGMNRVGVNGVGESVWLAWFLCDVLKRFAGLTEIMGNDQMAAGYREHARGIAAAVEEHAWDGKWYRRAWYDDGTVIGSSECEEAAIDSISQSWAVISGAGDPDRAFTGLNSAWKNLVLEDEKMALLLSPPFDRGEKDPGYIKGYPPGVRENGGQYTHASMWLAKALAMAGDGERAVRLLTWLNPVQHTLDPESALKYRTEPYSVAADVSRLDGHVGQGGWTWYTGAAGWMYRVWMEDILGLKVMGDRLVIDPSIPADWDRFTARYNRGTALYEIEVTNPGKVNRGVVSVEMDGKLLEDGVVPLAPDQPAAEAKVKHKVKVVMGKKM
ncbi:MAG: glucoamylase family protein [bacterium]|nr:glucoamylase family protein [bacterium]